MRTPDEHSLSAFRPLAWLRLWCLLTGIVLLAGCRTARMDVPSSADGLSARFKLTIPYRNAVYTVNGSLKLVHGERLQLSFQVPLVRAEVARVELTPDTLLLVDRMDKRYARLSVEEQQRLFGKAADLRSVETTLLKASTARGKAYVAVSELGLPMLDKGRIELSDFSDGPVRMSPTRLSSRYDRVEALELLDYLIGLSQ